MQLTEERVAELSAAFVRQIDSSGGPPLEFTEDSLRLLEVLFRRSQDDFERLPDSQRDVVVLTCGSFLGCSMAAILKGVWSFDDNWLDSSVVFSRPDGSGVQVRPFEKVWRRLSEPNTPNDLFAYFSELRGFLAGEIS